MASTSSSSGSSDSGYLLLDCGHMIVKGGTELNGQTRDDRQPMWDVSLSDIRCVQHCFVLLVERKQTLHCVQQQRCAVSCYEMLIHTRRSDPVTHKQ
jgi:hypothetical protein